MYHDLLTACRAAAYPLPFDDDGRPKSAHAALLAALRGPP